MKKYILYYNIGDLPIPKAKDFVANMVEVLRSSGIVEPDDKVVAFPVRGDQPTRLEVLAA